jgi:MoxR-like ATPase
MMTLATLPVPSATAPATALPLPADEPGTLSGEREQLRTADQLISLTRAADTAPGSDPAVQALALAAANLPVLLWGQPGIGKSSTVAFW